LSTTAEALPITETLVPADRAELIASIRDAFDADRAIYPFGGGTSLDFGLPATRDGLGLSLAGMAQVIDYPARDMTITVQAGMTIAALTDVLAAEGQRLPIDVPRRQDATLGGVVATNFSGPRRYGCGTLRDYVIGISAVDGTGAPFKGGGRVVKNVAGYDFCKLLIGSLGTLGVIHQLTLKLKPQPEESRLLVCDVPDLDRAELLLADMVHSGTQPAAIELLLGPHWRQDPAWADIDQDQAAAVLVAGLEGTLLDVNWMEERLTEEWGRHGVSSVRSITGEPARSLWERLAEFPQAGSPPLVLKASVVPSRTTEFVRLVQQLDPDASIQAHAGNGIVIVQVAQFSADTVSRTLVAKLLPAASAGHGNVEVLSNGSGATMTRQSYWGGLAAPYQLMTNIQKQFDPKGLLNPGRFVYEM